MRYTRTPNIPLKEAQLQGAHLHGGTQLQGANLWKTQLQGANLKEAQLQGTSFWYTQLQGANLTAAQLQGADLGMAQNLTQDQINIACVDKNTILPEGRTRPALCPIGVPITFTCTPDNIALVDKDDVQCLKK
jgi:hypothetical protein